MTSKWLYKWHERTITSTTGKQYGHHHALLVPDENDFSEYNDFRNIRWNIYYYITTIALLKTKSLFRWLVSVVIMLPKDLGRPKIHRVRIINTYESDYNLIRNYF